MSTTLISDGGVERTITRAELEAHLEQIASAWILRSGVRRLLLLPPDHTRLHSMAGSITAWFCRRLATLAQVDIMPALGTHAPMTPDECRLMFGDHVSFDRVIPHRWRQDLETIGAIDSDEMAKLSRGRFAESLIVEINRRIVSGEYDLILSIGQVVPHEVIGFANYTKNVCIGAGGKDVIHKSHFLGAVSDMETIMGQTDTPVRQLIDAAFERFVRPRARVRFILTAVEDVGGEPILRGLFAGDDQDCFRRACALSRRINVTIVDKPFQRCIVFLDPREFKSTWLGNKAIYRTRMAMADGGELIVLAPGVKMFGEDAEIDALIRQHGYFGTQRTLAAVERNGELASNLSAAAHLIHGSSEGRFRITYCPGPGMTRAEVEGVGYRYERYEDMVNRFGFDDLTDGWHEGADGKPFFCVRNPGLGLWATAEQSI